MVYELGLDYNCYYTQKYIYMYLAYYSTICACWISV